MDYKKINWMVLDSYSKLLNDYSTYINKELINEIANDNITTLDAYQIIIGSLFGLDIDKHKDLYNIYIRNAIKELDPSIYQSNLYYKNISFDNISYKDWKLGYEKYQGFEAFVYDDYRLIDYHIIPSIGYFQEGFKYPAIYQNNRLWMSICPNEINTMAKDILDAYGNVLVLGLGLGYYPYMIMNNPMVKSITIVELDKNLITFFKKEILPQFGLNSIEIINSDAIKYCENISKEQYDYVYSDLWHDVSDGVEIYHKLKHLEKKDIIYRYWIYETMKYYL